MPNEAGNVITSHSFVIVDYTRAKDRIQDCLAVVIVTDLPDEVVGLVSWVQGQAVSGRGEVVAGILAAIIVKLCGLVRNHIK